MDIDRQLISAVLRVPGAFAKAKRKQIVSDRIEGPFRDAWRFVENHVIEFGSLPSDGFLRAKTGIETEDVRDNIDAIIRDINDRYLWNKLKAKNEDVVRYLNDSKPRDALTIYEEIVRESYKEGLSGKEVESLWAAGADVLALYDRIKNGERGIPSPWEAMNEMTLGWWGGEFILFVARLGIGKTFSMLMMARKAWQDGKKVLFIGTEMTKTKLAMRLYAIHLHLPYNDFRHGRLGEFKEQEFRETVHELSKQEGISIVGSDFDSRIEDIESAIEICKPDILFVDGIYLIKNAGKERHSIVSNTANDLKRMSIRKNIPIVASHQFNRDVSPNSKSEITVERLAITDVLGWNADVCFGLYQTDDMKEDQIIGFRPLKLREGTGQDFFSNWNFNSMNFDQLVTAENIGEPRLDGEFEKEQGASVDDGWGEVDGGSGFLF